MTEERFGVEPKALCTATKDCHSCGTYSSVKFTALDGDGEQPTRHQRRKLVLDSQLGAVPTEVQEQKASFVIEAGPASFPLILRSGDE